MLPLAVHIANGVLEPSWLVCGGIVLAVALAVSLWKLDERDIPRIGVLTGAFFVASSIHIPIGTVSVHLLLNALVGVILRKRAALAIAVGLTMQALLFSHGGLDAIGVNFCVQAIPAYLCGALFNAFVALRRPRVPGFGLGLALGAGCAALTVLLHVTVLYLGGRGDWSVLAGISLVAHLPVIAIEGIGVGFAVRVLAKGKPEWLGLRPSDDQSPGGNISSNGTSH
jgi:cobalt/nickel transport system permease protein